jgi:hypothetical protein
MLTLIKSGILDKGLKSMLSLYERHDYTECTPIMRWLYTFDSKFREIEITPN